MLFSCILPFADTPLFSQIVAIAQTSIHPPCVLLPLSPRWRPLPLPSNFLYTATRPSLRAPSNAQSSRMPKPAASLRPLQSPTPPSTNRVSASLVILLPSKLPAPPSARTSVTPAMWPRLHPGISPTVPTTVSLLPPKLVPPLQQTRQARRLLQLLLQHNQHRLRPAPVARKAQARLRRQTLITIGRSTNLFSIPTTNPTQVDRPLEVDRHAHCCLCGLGHSDHHPRSPSPPLPPSSRPCKRSFQFGHHPTFYPYPFSNTTYTRQGF